MNKMNNAVTLKHAAFAASVALCVVSAPTQAEVLNIPSSAAALVSNGLCNRDAAEIYGGGNPAGSGVCYLSFPISIPAGRTIDQISIVHSSFPFNGQSYVYAYLTKHEMSWPYSVDQYFYLFETMPVPQYTVATDALMGSFDRLGHPAYPDAFQVDPSILYHVDLVIYGGTDIHGVQITYQ